MNDLKVGVARNLSAFIVVITLFICQASMAGDSGGASTMTLYRDAPSGAEFLMPEKFKKREKNGKHIFIAPRTEGYVTFQTRDVPDGNNSGAKAIIHALAREMKEKYGATVRSTEKMEVKDLTGWRLRSRWVLKKGNRRRQIAQDETVFVRGGKAYRFGLVSPPEHYKKSRIVYDMVVESFKFSAEKKTEKTQDNEVPGPFTLPGGIRAGNKENNYEAYVDADGRLHLLDKKDDVIFVIESTGDAQERKGSEDKNPQAQTAKNDREKDQEGEKHSGRNVIASTSRMEKGATVREQKKGDEQPVTTAHVSGERDRVIHRGYRGPFLQWGGGFGGEITDVVASDILVHQNDRVIDLGAGRRPMSVYEQDDGQTVRVRLKGTGNILNVPQPKRRITRSIDASGGRVLYTFHTSDYRVTIALRRQPENEEDGE